jgi:alanine racemase
LAEVDIRTSIRPTVAEIDLTVITGNLARLRQTVGDGVAIWGVVKADAYGHGAVAVARALEPLSNALAVSLVEEGLELRAAGIRIPIVVLGAFYNRHQDDVLNEGLTPVIYDSGDLERFATSAARLGRRVAVHLKVDTGMSRLGFSVDALPSPGCPRSKSLAWRPTSRRRTAWIRRSRSNPSRGSAPASTWRARAGWRR